MIKTLSKLGIEGNVLNMTEGIYEKPTANNSMVKEWKLSPLRSGTRQGMPTFTTAIHHCPGGPS